MLRRCGGLEPPPTPPAHVSPLYDLDPEAERIAQGWAEEMLVNLHRAGAGGHLLKIRPVWL